MAVSVRLPGYLQQFAGGKDQLSGEGTTVREVLGSVARSHPGVTLRVLTEQGEVRQHINVFVGEKNCRFEDGLDTVVPEGAEILVLAAVSGG